MSVSSLLQTLEQFSLVKDPADSTGFNPFLGRGEGFYTNMIKTACGIWIEVQMYKHRRAWLGFFVSSLT